MQLTDLALSTSHITKDSYYGICLFQRHETAEAGMRGYHLRSIGVLVAQSSRPRPWRHISALRDLLQKIYGSDIDNFAPVESYYEEHKAHALLNDDDKGSLSEEYSDDLVVCIGMHIAIV